LHGKCGLGGAQGIIVMGNGGAEECHDTVADILVDVAAVSGDDAAEAFEASIHQVANLFGRQVFGQRSKAAQVGKENGDVAQVAGFRAGRLDVFRCKAGAAIPTKAKRFGHFRKAMCAGNFRHGRYAAT
jgi:hypothetical protein